MISQKKLGSYFLILGVVIGCLAVLLILLSLACFEEPAELETQLAVLHAEPYEHAVWNQPNRYEEAMRLISVHHRDLLALADSGSNEVQIFITAGKQSGLIAMPEPLASQLLQLIDPVKRGSPSVLLYRNGDIKLRLKVRKDFENYLYLFHHVTNFQATSDLIKSVKTGRYYYQIEVFNAFNEIDPCNFSPN